MAAIQESYMAGLPQPEWVEGTQADSSLSIQNWERLSIREYEEGLQWTHLVTLNDGSRYVFRSTKPHHPTWETPCDFRPPLATRVKGFNTHMALKLAQAGVYSRIIGTNQSRGFDMEHEANATMLILAEDDNLQDERPHRDFARGRSIGTGYSMGAMDLLQELTVSGIQRQFVANIGIDPCLAKPFNPQRELAQPWENLLYLYKEGQALAAAGAIEFANDKSLLKHKTLLYLGRLAGTVSPSPQFLTNTYDKWLMLATGDAGQKLEQIPNDAVLIVHFFKNSRMNDAAIYNARLTDGHPYFRGIVEEGTHLTGADRRIIEGTVKKVATALKMYEQDQAPQQAIAEALDYPLLTDVA